MFPWLTRGRAVCVDRRARLRGSAARRVRSVRGAASGGFLGPQHEVVTSDRSGQVALTRAPRRRNSKVRCSPGLAFPIDVLRTSRPRFASTSSTTGRPRFVPRSASSLVCPIATSGFSRLGVRRSSARTDSTIVVSSASDILQKSNFRGCHRRAASRTLYNFFLNVPVERCWRSMPSRLALDIRQNGTISV